MLDPSRFVLLLKSNNFVSPSGSARLFSTLIGEEIKILWSVYSCSPKVQQNMTDFILIVDLGGQGFRRSSMRFQSFIISKVGI